jgi:hypothetical protein
MARGKQISPDICKLIHWMSFNNDAVDISSTLSGASTGLSRRYELATASYHSYVLQGCRMNAEKPCHNDAHVDERIGACKCETFVHACGAGAQPAFDIKRCILR